VPPVDCAHANGTEPRPGDTTGSPQCVPATACDLWLPARVRARSAKKRRVQTRPRPTTTCPLYVPWWEGEGLGPTLAGPQEAQRGRASDPRAGTTRQVPRPRTRARGQRDRSPQSLSRVAGDRLSVPSDCSRREASLCEPTRWSSARLTNVRVANACVEAFPGPLAPKEKAAPAGPAKGNWWRSPNALPGEARCTRASTPDPTMPVHWTAHDARTDDMAIATIIGVRPRNAIGRHTWV